VLQHVWDDVGHESVDAVLGLGGDVEQPLVEEVGDVVLVGGGGGIDGDVAGPAEPFVALGTVGRDVEEVALLTPDRVADQLVDTAVGAREPPGAGHLRVHDDGFQVVGGQLAWKSADLGVAETVKGQRGLELVLAAGQDERVRGPSPA
jgi:hypothetical protein